MKRALGCLAAILLLMGTGYVLAAYVLAWEIARQLPAPLQAAARGWLLGTPQTVGHPRDSDLLPGQPGQRFASGGYYWAPGGYRGPASFRCALPVAQGTLTSPYGDTAGRTHPHTGVDYGTYQQSVTVYAPLGGEVTHAGWNPWLGWTVVIENDGWQVILGHHCCGTAGKEAEPTGPSSLQVTPGQILEAGAPVGLTGDTGNSFGIHLHLEVRRCTGETCTLVDPSAVLLPGQRETCDWEALRSPGE
jgi:murein DD-endopeptidase MepM/ murein hydrolase activator NlpD